MMSKSEETFLQAGRNTCPVCKKVFYITGTGWAYKEKKTNGKYVCSYKCMRATEKKKELKGSKPKK